jgi:exonuclease III
MRKGLVNFMQQENADVYCFQETKAMKEQINDAYIFACGWL